MSLKKLLLGTALFATTASVEAQDVNPQALHSCYAEGIIESGVTVTKLDTLRSDRGTPLYAMGLGLGFTVEAKKEFPTGEKLFVVDTLIQRAPSEPLHTGDVNSRHIYVLSAANDTLYSARHTVELSTTGKLVEAWRISLGKGERAEFMGGSDNRLAELLQLSKNPQEAAQKLKEAARKAEQKRKESAYPKA